MCQACDHPKRQALEQDIRAGMTSVRVTKTYGLRHHAVVMQHKRRHMLAIYASPLIVEDESQSQDAAFDVERVEASQSQSIALTVESAHNPQQAGFDLAARQPPLMTVNTSESRERAIRVLPVLSVPDVRLSTITPCLAEREYRG